MHYILIKNKRYLKRGLAGTAFMRNCLFEWFYIIYNIQHQGGMHSKITAIHLLSETVAHNQRRDGDVIQTDYLGFTSVATQIYCNR